MDNVEFKQLTLKVYNQVMKIFDQLDPDDAEASFQLDNITISFRDKTIFVINRQPPVHQLWLATKNKGYHFNYDHASSSWISDRTGEEFFAVLLGSASKHLGFALKAEI